MAIFILAKRNMQLNQAGIDLVKEFEGCKLEAYLCPAGIPTIGYGRTYNVSMGAVIDQEQAERFLIEDLKKASNAVKSYVSAPLNENQFSALVSFVYNIGPGQFKYSTLLAHLNFKKYQAAADEFLKWVHAKGQVSPGLVRRREAERQLFLKPVEAKDDLRA